jgi:hypothetical protein
MDVRINPQPAAPPLPKEQKRFLPALAEMIAEWFPEVGGRALAVSAAEINKLNVPTLPLVMVAFERSTGDQSLVSFQPRFTISDVFVIEFWLEPSRYKKANGSETPFWSYYDYEAVRDKLLQNISRWPTPGGEHIAYRMLTISADELAVTLTFRFVATFEFCKPFADEGEPYAISYNLCPPKGCCPPCITEPIEENDQCDPCP